MEGENQVLIGSQSKIFFFPRKLSNNKKKKIATLTDFIIVHNRQSHVMETNMMYLLKYDG